MHITKAETLQIRGETDIVQVRQTVRRLAGSLTFSLTDQTKLVTAASEIARNTLVYGGGGVLDIHILGTDSRRGLRMVFIDEGPGIADVSLALQDGYTSGGGLGLGLGGSKRLVSEFDITSEPGRGTQVTLTSWK